MLIAPMCMNHLRRRNSFPNMHAYKASFVSYRRSSTQVDAVSQRTSRQELVWFVQPIPANNMSVSQLPTQAQAEGTECSAHLPFPFPFLFVTPRFSICTGIYHGRINFLHPPTPPRNRHPKRKSPCPTVHAFHRSSTASSATASSG
jgi:hypothetical protein